MSFHKKPWYIKKDCLFCTRSASSFCRKPLYFLEHAMWVKWWHHANFQPFQSSFVVLFSISGSYSSKKPVNAWKITNEARKGWKSMMWLWMVHFEHKKLGVQISSRKWNPFVIDEFSCETLILRMRLSILYTKCIQFLP